MTRIELVDGSRERAVLDLAFQGSSVGRLGERVEMGYGSLIAMVELTRVTYVVVR